MKLFDDTIIKETFSIMSEKFIMNELYEDQYKIDGFITNATLSPNSSYHFHSLDLFDRGHILTFNDEYYMVTSDVVLMRGSKYKGIVDYCNYSRDVIRIEQVLIGIDNINRPIYNDVETFNRTEYGVLRYKDIQIEVEDAINQVTPILALTLRDTEDNKMDYAVNTKMKIHGREYRVYDIQYVKRGLMQIRLQ